MKRFKENDEEIDAMLDRVIEVAQRINLHAQDIGVQIKTQADLLNQVNHKAEKARQNLIAKNSSMTEALEKFRSTNKMCCDMIIIIVVLTLIGVGIKMLKSKGYI